MGYAKMACHPKLAQRQFRAKDGTGTGLRERLEHRIQWSCRVRTSGPTFHPGRGRTTQSPWLSLRPPVDRHMSQVVSLVGARAGTRCWLNAGRPACELAWET